MSIKDTQIQAAAFKSHVQSDGSNIGGVDPKAYGGVVMLDGDDLLLWTEGNTGKPTDYPAWMWYPAQLRPILPNSGKVRMSFEATVSGNLGSVNVRETDLIIVDQGWKYNMSAQQLRDGDWEIADKNGNWVKVGFNPGPIRNGLPSRIAIDYAIDTQAHTCSVVEINQDDSTFGVVPSLQKVSAQPSTWQEGAYVQLQLGSMPSALPWQLRVSGSGDGLCLEWS